MIDFFKAHQQDLIYSIFVIVIVIILRVLTNMLHKWVVKEKKRKFPTEAPKSTNLLKKILNALWIILGIIALSYLFVENDDKSIVINEFKTVLYVGLVLAVTLIVATTINLWFKLDIQKKIESNQDPTSIKFLRSVVIVGIYLFIWFYLVFISVSIFKRSGTNRFRWGWSIGAYYWCCISRSIV